MQEKTIKINKTIRYSVTWYLPAISCARVSGTFSVVVSVTSSIHGSCPEWFDYVLGPSTTSTGICLSSLGWDKNGSLPLNLGPLSNILLVKFGSRRENRFMLISLAEGKRERGGLWGGIVGSSMSMKSSGGAAMEVVCLL